MLVARRDPPLHAGEFDGPRLHGHGHSRFMTAVQVIGTLVGIPVGLASAYSIYHSNFTVEARCETLRGSIISMLDKSADASTLRMLVRRDVVTFETNCGVVDPDAVKAFKALLAAKDLPKAAPKVETKAESRLSPRRLPPSRRSRSCRNRPRKRLRSQSKWPSQPRRRRPHRSRLLLTPSLLKPGLLKPSLLQLSPSGAILRPRMQTGLVRCAMR